VTDVTTADAFGIRADTAVMALCYGLTAWATPIAVAALSRACDKHSPPAARKPSRQILTRAPRQRARSSH
jgi:hypothetical protein